MSDNTMSGAGGQGEPPGWYADPWGRADQRWWNGFEWSDQTRADPVEQLPTEGWYDDPDDSTVERWWDGQQWSGQTRPASESERAVTEWQARRISDPEPAPASKWAQSTAAQVVGWVLLLSIVGVVVAVFVAGGDSSPSRPPGPSIEGSEIEAYLACQDFTERQLRAPSTAQFPSQREATITTRGNQWVVEAYVDAENAFGAMIRNEWRCTASRSGDTWTGRSTILE